MTRRAPAGSTDGSMTVEYGNVKALHTLAERLDLIETINRIAPKRNGIPVGELTLLMAINRCVEPRAKLNIPAWYERTFLPELLGIELPHDSGYKTLTRCLDYLTDDVQMEIEMALAGRTLETFGIDPTTCLYDTSSTFVEGEGIPDLLRFGYSRDHRPDRKQVNFAFCVTKQDAIPLFHQVFPGNMADSKTIKDTMVRFQDRLGLDGCMVVDRGIVTAANIAEIVDERGLDLVGGLRMDRRLRRLAIEAGAESFEDEFNLRDETIHAREYRLALGKGTRRCLLYLSPAKAARDRKARTKRLRAAETKMKAFAAKLNREGPGRKPNPKNLGREIDRFLEKKQCLGLIEWRFVGGRGGRRLKWERNEEKLAEAEALDGKYWLVTSLDAGPDEILGIYRSRDGVERAFRITKENIRIRPIWNRTEEHIKAHLFICYLAYLLMALLQVEVRRDRPTLTSVKALDALRSVTKVVGRTLHSEDGAGILQSLMGPG